MVYTIKVFVVIVGSLHGGIVRFEEFVRKLGPGSHSSQLVGDVFRLRLVAGKMFCISTYFLSQ